MCIYIHRPEVKFGCHSLGVRILFLSQGLSLVLNSSWKLWWLVSKHPRVSCFLALGLLFCLTVLEWNLFWGSNSYLHACKVSILATVPSHPQFCKEDPHFTKGKEPYWTAGYKEKFYSGICSVQPEEAAYQGSGESKRGTWLSSLFSLLRCSNHNTSDWITNASGEGNVKWILLHSLSKKNKSSPHKAHYFWHEQTNKQIGNKTNQFLGKKETVYFVIHTG